MGSQKSASGVTQVKVGSVAWSGSITSASSGTTMADAQLNWLITL
jgi:hypothetical protein